MITDGQLDEVFKDLRSLKRDCDKYCLERPKLRLDEQTFEELSRAVFRYWGPTFINKSMDSSMQKMRIMGFDIVVRKDGPRP